MADVSRALVAPSQLPRDGSPLSRTTDTYMRCGTKRHDLWKTIITFSDNTLPLITGAIMRYKLSMSQPGCREILLSAIATQTTNGSSPVMVLPQGYTAAILTLNVLTVSGTSPTLNIFIQNRLRQAAAADLIGQDLSDTGTAIFDDLLAFTQATTSNTAFVFRIVGGGNTVGANKNKTLTAGTAQSGPIGGAWQVAWAVGGTSPSFAFSVCAQLLP